MFCTGAADLTASFRRVASFFADNLSRFHSYSVGGFNDDSAKQEAEKATTTALCKGGDDAVQETETSKRRRCARDGTENAPCKNEIKALLEHGFDTADIRLCSVLQP
ncbi:uncharacterized protein G2W53_014164 [Senna tora]|uniref:Uncharacterized protein n=1 Tax=Senna tora TaxID=362788 RepID=A0A834WSY8_9FABA|nr:uncharacterized protein G2W53_014164 [Senna tora]